MSADGRYVTFTSEATNLTPEDTNWSRDVFRKDLTTGAVERVSVASSGAQGSADSHDPRMSSDSQRVVFVALAPNLAPGDSGLSVAVFVRDLRAGTTKRISATTPKRWEVSLLDLSANGRVAGWVESAYGTTNSCTDLTTFSWRASAGTKRVAGPSCTGPGAVQAFNTGLAQVTSGGRDGAYWNRIAVRPKAPYQPYSWTCRTPEHVYACQFDVAAWGAVSVVGGPGHIVRFDALGNRTQLNRGDSPVISADGNAIAFQDRQNKLWDYRSGSVTLVSVSSG